MKLTIGMATYDDFNGVYFTLQSLRIHHAEAMKDVELIVIDNNPDSQEGRDTRAFMNWIKGDVAASRYIPFTEIKGTAAPRNQLFVEAQGDAVLCLDPHVLLQPGVVKRLIEWYDALRRNREYGWPTTTPCPAGEPDSSDLYSGPMLYDDLRNRATHFADQWRGEMWGIWATDERGDPHHHLNYTGEPFEIPAMGLGLFTCRREAWLGFNPNFRGFGGEEFYIHEKYRQAGRKNWCLPWLTWLHRFARPGGVKYSLQRWDKVRNYIIGHTELGLPLDRVYEHFVTGKRISQDDWDVMIKDPKNPPVKPACGACGKSTQSSVGQAASSSGVKKAPAIPDGITLEKMFAGLQSQPGNGYMQKLREVAAKCEHVTEVGIRPVASTVAILTGQPKTFVSYVRGGDPILENLKSRRGNSDFSYQIADSLSIAIEKTDLLLIGTEPTAARLWDEMVKHADSAKWYIGVFGASETSRGGSAGGLHAVRRFAKFRPAWTVIHNADGLMILSKRPEDRMQPPGAIRKAINFSKALIAHAKAGSVLVDDDVYEARLNACLMCEHRAFDACGKCGCPIDKKASWAEQQCPDSPPKWLALSVIKE